MQKRLPFAMLMCSACCCLTAAAPADPLVDGFRRPPASAQPWTYWFWINGNITREGITADLEAMARVGIHGVLIMEVARPNSMAPTGPVAFGSPTWRELFRHAVNEARRLGLEINLNNDAGWTGSGGPWITPELSMQKLVSASFAVEGPRHCEQVLPQPAAVQGFYRDIKVLAYPAPPSALAQAAPAPKAKKQPARKAAKAPASAPPPADPIALERIVDLTAHVDATGKLTWDAPAGHWVVQRIGHTSTGQKNKPAPVAGLGLECDKFSAEAMRRHFDAFLGQLVDEAGPAPGRSFNLTHIDSWEVAGQNWTPRMAVEFARRRGYAMVPWLITLAGGPPVASAEQTRRFLRDCKRTQSELMNENYAAALRTLAHQRGLQLSIEAYGPNGDFINPLDYAPEADLPMAEFWVARWGAWHLQSSRLVSSAAHAAGQAIVGAESFTSLGENDAFTQHPYSIKTVGDWAFSEGVNRFIFHRTVLQPWAGHEPGMSFGPYGTHFDRNQTWWELGRAFMQYLARCQILLQQGRFVADVCRLVPDGETHGSKPGMAALPGRYPVLPDDCNFDYVSDQMLIGKASVVQGRLTLPSGMSYRVMQLPEDGGMTPELLRKIRDLVHAGAVVVGPRPERSPSLQDYPRCDAEVKALAAELWGECDGRTVTERRFGAGWVYWGRPIADVLRAAQVTPDLQFTLDPPAATESIQSINLGAGKVMGDEPLGFMPTRGLNWIHRRAGETEIYFLANPQHRAVEARCSFRVTGRQPELWNPETGEILQPAAFSSNGGRTTLPIHFTPAGSVFVLFRSPADPAAQVVRVLRNGAAVDQPTDLWRHGAGVELLTTTADRYEIQFADGRTRSVEAHPIAAPQTIPGPWQVSFQPGRGAPPSAEFPALIDWAQHAQDGIRHFSGTASYTGEFAFSDLKSRTFLDLGRVEVVAEVRLNGVDLGVLWKPPFVVEVTRALRPGRNQLEVKVANLWVNRLIGDERFPDDCTPGGTWKAGPLPAWPEWFVQNRPRPEPRRVTFTTWKYYTADSPLVPSGLLGPVTLQTVRTVAVE